MREERQREQQQQRESSSKGSRRARDASNEDDSGSKGALRKKKKTKTATSEAVQQSFIEETIQRQLSATLERLLPALVQGSSVGTVASNPAGDSNQVSSHMRPGPQGFFGPSTHPPISPYGGQAQPQMMTHSWSGPSAAGPPMNWTSFTGASSHPSIPAYGGGEQFGSSQGHMPLPPSTTNPPVRSSSPGAYGEGTGQDKIQKQPATNFSGVSDMMKAFMEYMGQKKA